MQRGLFFLPYRRGCRRSSSHKRHTLRTLFRLPFQIRALHLIGKEKEKCASAASLDFPVTRIERTERTLSKERKQKNNIK